MPKTHVETAPKSYLTRKNWCLTNKNWYLSLITTKSQVWPPKTLHFLTFDPQNHRICFPHPPPMEKISGDPPLDGVEPHVAHAISTCFRLVGIPESHQVMAGWLGYGSIPIIVQCYYPISSPIYNRYFPNYPIWVWINTYENTITLGGWTSILTQLFWCEQKGYYWYWHTATWIWGYPDDLDDFSIWNMEIEFFKIKDVGDMKPTNSSWDLWDLGLRKWI